MDTPDDFTTLETDATLAEPLRRVVYEAGMMLGLEATRDEQAYHRRRLNRHQYWLHGYGTLAGMRVDMNPATSANSSDPVRVQLRVSPGLGIDGLGREVLIHETYALSLNDWLKVQTPTHLEDGFDPDTQTLWLNVCVRQHDIPVAQQPVLARKLNLTTDAVQPSRTADSVRLELVPEIPPAADSRYQPWACHSPLADSLPALTSAEQATLAAASGATASQLALHARLLHALDATGVSTRELHDAFDEGARLLLARVALSPVTGISQPDKILVNPQRIAINNLVRPFLASASQLAWLARQP